MLITYHLSSKALFCGRASPDKCGTAAGADIYRAKPVRRASLFFCGWNLRFHHDSYGSKAGQSPALLRQLGWQTVVFR